MPGLIWVRDLVVGDGLVDGSVRVGWLRPLGLWGAAAHGREPQQLRELVGSVVLIEECRTFGAGRGGGGERGQVVGIGSRAAGPRSRRTWKDRRASLRAMVSEARVWL